MRAAGLEGWFSINVVARYFANGRTVRPGRFVAPATADARPDLSGPPSEDNVIPNPPVVVGTDPAKAPTELAKFRLWGQSFADHCVH